jgi:cell division protein FtsB
MPKKRANAGTVVSLFPFLSILACVIGSLTLILAGIVLGQIGGGSSLQQYERMKSQIASLETTNDVLGQKVAQAVGQDMRLSEDQEDANQIQLPVPEEEVRAVLSRLPERNRLRENVKELEDRLNRLIKELQTIHAEAADGQKRVLRLIPERQGRGLGKGLQPNYVECTASGLVLYPEKTSVPTSQIGSDGLFLTLIDRVRSRSDQSIMLLVRPNGVSAFDAAQSKLGSEKFSKYGYIPLPPDGEIEFYQDTGNR